MKTMFVSASEINGEGYKFSKVQNFKNKTW
jgi:hypothetical protein